MSVFFFVYFFFMGVGSDIASLLAENENLLGIPSAELAVYLEWLEEMDSFDEEYVDTSFMDEEDTYPIKRGQQWEDHELEDYDTESE